MGAHGYFGVSSAGVRRAAESVAGSQLPLVRVFSTTHNSMSCLSNRSDPPARSHGGGDVAPSTAARRKTSMIDEYFVGGNDGGGGGGGAPTDSTPARPKSFFDEYSVGGRGLHSPRVSST